MSYFKHFETVEYNGYETVNILNSVIARHEPIKNSALYYYYTLLDGEQAEDVSYKVYQDSGFGWLLYAINNIVDPYHDWLMSAQCLESFMSAKYGDDLYGVHHFENINTNKWCDGYDSTKYQALIDDNQPVPHNIQVISNREYEILSNEDKRNIKVISMDYVNDIQEDFEELMNERQEEIGIIK